MKRHFMPHYFLEIELANLVEYVGDFDVFLQEFEAGIVAVDFFDGRMLGLRFDREKMPASTLIARLVQHIAIKDIHIKEPDTETIVRDLYEAKAMNNHE